MWSSWWNDNWQERPKYSEKTRPSATLSAINPTWPDLGSSPGCSGGKPVTNHHSYGATWQSVEETRDKAIRTGENYIMRNSKSHDFHYLHSLLTNVRVTSSRLQRTGHEYAWDELEMRARFWSENHKRRDCLEDLGVDGKIALKWTLKEIRWQSED
jgi:hypothetical protein